VYCYRDLASWYTYSSQNRHHKQMHFHNHTVCKELRYSFPDLMVNRIRKTETGNKQYFFISQELDCVWNKKIMKLQVRFIHYCVRQVMIFSKYNQVKRSWESTVTYPLVHYTCIDFKWVDHLLYSWHILRGCLSVLYNT